MATQNIGDLKRPGRRRFHVVPSGEPESYEIIAQSGQRRRFGSGQAVFAVRVRDLSSWDYLTAAGVYAIATAFVRGQFEVDGDVLAAVRWWHAHRTEGWRDWAMTMVNRLLFESRFQRIARARRNVQFHYDRSNLFYQQFLDERMVYSSAYFADPACSLDEAQFAKLEDICRKLEMRPGDLFLDVGCGWGALIIHAAERFGASAVGCTLSAQQLVFARQAAAQRDLQGRVLVEDLDYRAVPGRFDKIASIGMYEHVGRHRLRGYFLTLAALLAPDGLLLNQGIARPQDTRDDGTTVFLQRYVFPGGELPQLSDVVCAAERAGFEVLAVENLRLHYALTCGAWVARLTAHRDACLALVDASTYRTWLLYLAAAAVSFERGQTDLYQTLLAKRGARVRRRLSCDYMHP